MRRAHYKNFVYSSKNFYLYLSILSIFQTANMVWLACMFDSKSDIPIIGNNIDGIPQHMAAMEAQLMETNLILRDILDDQRHKHPVR